MNMMRNNNRNNNRNRGGNRSNNNRRYNNGGGNRQQNDGQNLQRQKHHATQMLGKYNDLLRNAQNNGDRVDVEYYLQHIEHYTRVLAGIAEVEAERFAQYRDTSGAQENQQPDGAEGDAQAGSAENTEASPEVQSQGGERPQRQQQRPQRQQRRPYQQQAAQAENGEAAPTPSHNGAAEANANTVEIPLPGSILPPI